MAQSKLVAIIEALFILIVGLALLPTLRSYVATAVINASSGDTGLLNLLSTFWVIALLGVGAGLVYSAFKNG